MKRAMRIGLLAFVAMTLATPAMAFEDVFKGTLVCAKCGLKKPEAKECQDVLLVTDAQGATTEYYITKNAVAEESGEACTLKIPATVTGTVAKKDDGTLWLTATKIVKEK